MRPRIIIGFVLTVLILIILFQNLESVRLQILFWKLNLSLLLIIVIAFLLGIVTGWLFKPLKKLFRAQESSKS